MFEKVYSRVRPRRLVKSAEQNIQHYICLKSERVF